MDIIDNLSSLEKGWSLVNHFLGNAFLAIRFSMEKKENLRVAELRDELASRLAKIAERVSALGYAKASGQIDEIRQMVEKCDFADDSQIKAIDAKYSEYYPAVAKMEEAVKEMAKRAQSSQGPS